VTCRPSLTTIASLTDEVECGYVAVEVDAARIGQLSLEATWLDVGRLAGAVYPETMTAPFAPEARQDRERGRGDRSDILIDVRDGSSGSGVGRHLHVAVDAETWRTDTFMSGWPATCCAAAAIAPPWPGAGTRGAKLTLRIDDRETKLAETAKRCDSYPAAKPISAIFMALRRGGHVALTELGRFQVVVGLDDLHEAVLAGAFAAVRIGLVALQPGSLNRALMSAGDASISRSSVPNALRSALWIGREDPRPCARGGRGSALGPNSRIRSSGSAASKRSASPLKPSSRSGRCPTTRVLLIREDVVLTHAGELIVGLL